MPHDGATIEKRLTPGEAFVSLDGYKAARAKMPGARVRLSVETKATLTEGTFKVGGIAPAYYPPRPMRLLVQDLMLSGSTDSNGVNYLQTSSSTPSIPGVIPEGTPKGNILTSVVLKTAPVNKVAGYSKITDEFFSDQPAFESFANSFMQNALASAIEKQIVTDINAVAQTIVNGANTADGVFSTVLQAKDYVRNFAQVEADGIVLNMAAYELARKDKGTGGNYQGQGPFSYGEKGELGKIYFDKLWGIPCVITAAVPPTTILVGNFRESAQIFYRENLTLSTTNADQDDFEKNIITTRLEARLATVIYTPWAFFRITLT